jgi:hypothetical protein
VDFKGKKPVFKDINKRPEFLIEISFPTSEVSDLEAKSRALLGVKHGSTNEVLGVPNQEIAKRMGFPNYRKLRLKHATEEERYPELAMAVDQGDVPGGIKSPANGQPAVPEKKKVVKVKAKAKNNPTE